MSGSALAPHRELGLTDAEVDRILTAAREAARLAYATAQPSNR